MTPKRLRILQPLTSKPWQLITTARRHFASSSDIKTNHKPKSAKPSLYDVLFPKAPTPKPTTASPSNRNTTSPKDDPEPPRISLQDDDELGEWMKQLHFTFLHDSNKTDTQDQKADVPTVLILSAPRDLQESDFYRVAPQGQHVQGWTSGPDKVIQLRSQTHLTPLELYYLFFPSRASATYYLSLLKQQHSHSRSLLLSHLSSSPLSRPSSPIPYSLIPPTTPTIPSTLHPVSSLTSHYFTHHLPQSPLPPSSRLLPLLHPLSPHLSFPPIDFPQQNFVLLRLTNGKLPPRSLYHFLHLDTLQNRNRLPWALLTREQQKKYKILQLSPLPATRSYVKLPEGYTQKQQQQQQQQQQGQEGEEGEETTQIKLKPSDLGEKGELKVYSRFLLGFEHPAEAKRFARCWHKKELVDTLRDQRVICNTTVLW
ncbi:hypothetical protein QBC40DRAFT_345766 [Triangularia verruculosa]|uniref:Uncharacterized protein n=1 Tax=Triangularia verruculosa TaxID=2587418 RepID=A0AAN6XNT4_9PEZI|nr:hypothetical protein QBC40DRAFT_345766 [Triangularia verruculosa]